MKSIYNSCHTELGRIQRMHELAETAEELAQCSADRELCEARKRKMVREAEALCELVASTRHRPIRELDKARASVERVAIMRREIDREIAPRDPGVAEFCALFEGGK